MKYFVSLACVLAALATVPAAAEDKQVIGPGDGRVLSVPMHPTKQLVQSSATPSGSIVYEITLDAKSPGAPAHVHANEDEFLYVIEGTMTVQLGDQTFSAEKGALVVKPRGQVHAFWNATESKASALLFVNGEGSFETFFNQVEAAAAEPSGTVPFEAQMAELAEQSDIEIVMDQLALEALPFYQK
ncbi:MAG: cupin domain-containing protein [Hyphomonas sp.]|jgi:quercetin dioxygenase-like cupin family protein|nr:cupin domain-containing protein [Hyphomonas sp.]